MTDRLDSAQAAISDGTGIYPYYDAHWHLWQIGVLSGDYESPAWDAAEGNASADPNERSRVVLIDNSVDVDHPNLRDAIDRDRMIDFLSHRLGVLATPPDAKANPFRAIKAPDELFAAKSPVAALYAELVDRLMKTGSTAALQTQKVVPATSAHFSAHGTGMAGLIGARPVADAPSMPREAHELPDAIADQLTAGTRVMPYVGVDPYCRIVPVSTSFDEDPEQLILALLYAEMVEADVIVIARDFPDPREFTSTTALPASYQPLADRPGDEILWDALKDLILTISQRRPILCAAGNGGDENAIYPANLARPDNGIVAVGAVTSQGFRAGYSPAPGAVDIHGPSGDGERFDDQTIALDTRSAAFDPTVHTPAMLAINGPIKQTPYSYRDLITTDVSGRYGYNGGLFNDPADRGQVLDFGAYYARFSGTSGATAVTGGFLSLAYSARKFPRPRDGAAGPDIKAMLKAALLSAKGEGTGGPDQIIKTAPDGGESRREHVPFPRWEAAPDVLGSKTS